MDLMILTGQVAGAPPAATTPLGALLCAPKRDAIEERAAHREANRTVRSSATLAQGSTTNLIFAVAKTATLIVESSTGQHHIWRARTTTVPFLDISYATFDM
jgi:hypothetical protein